MYSVQREVKYDLYEMRERERERALLSFAAADCKSGPNPTDILF